MTSVDTSTTSAAKEHARAQSGVVTDSMPVVPASSWPTPPSDIDPAQLPTEFYQKINHSNR